jgi:hypothetical protein
MQFRNKNEYKNPKATTHAGQLTLNNYRIGKNPAAHQSA